MTQDERDELLRRTAWLSDVAHAFADGIVVGWGIMVVVGVGLLLCRWFSA